MKLIQNDRHYVLNTIKQIKINLYGKCMHLTAKTFGMQDKGNVMHRSHIGLMFCLKIFVCYRKGQGNLTLGYHLILGPHPIKR